MENGSACRSERSNLFSVLRGPRFKTLRQCFDRTPESEHMAIWEIAHIRLLILRTHRVVLCPVNGAAVSGAAKRQSQPLRNKIPFALLEARIPSDPRPIPRLI